MIKWKTLIRFKDVCVNKEHRVLLSYCPITAISALKVGHTCTASTATTDCGVATTTHLECSATAPTVCVCSTGYSGPTAGDCGGWHIPIVYCGRKKKEKTNKKRSAICSTWRSLCRRDSKPPNPPPHPTPTRTTHPPLPLILVWSCAVEETLNYNKASAPSFNKPRLHK